MARPRRRDREEGYNGDDQRAREEERYERTERRSASEAADRISLLRNELDLIVRIDERTQVIANEIKDIKSVMVTKVEFSPVKLLVYGMVGIMLSTVVAAILSVVVLK